MFKKIPIALAALTALIMTMTFSSACSDDTDQPVKKDTGVPDNGTGDITVKMDGKTGDMKKADMKKGDGPVTKDGLVNVDMKKGDGPATKDGLVNVDMKKVDGPVLDLLPPADMTPDKPYSPTSSPSPWKFQQGWRFP